MFTIFVKAWQSFSNMFGNILQIVNGIEKKNLNFNNKFQMGGVTCFVAHIILFFINNFRNDLGIYICF